MTAGSTILVVEDEALIANDLQRTLRKLGYNVPLTAATGRQAIEAVKSIHPQLILMDIRLQGPMDGIQTAAAVRSECDLPVVYLTSYSDDSTLARAMETSPSGYLLKPFNDRELSTTIEVALQKHQLETKLAESRRWLSTILQSIGDAVIVTDRNNIVTIMNVVAEGLSGWASDAAIGRSLDDLFHLVDSSGAAILSPVEASLPTRVASDLLQDRPAPKQGDGVTLSDHTRLVRVNGSELPVAATWSPLRDPKGGMTGSVLVFRDITHQQLQQQRLEVLAFIDPLTGIANRRALDLRFRQELARSKRYKRPLSCLMMDIDHFKSINDKYGHALGDSVLALIADLLPKETRDELDLVARYGGEEFVILLPETALPGAMTTAERIRARVASATISAEHLRVTVSIGVATGAAEDLMVRADQAMYCAKRAGRNRVAGWDEIT